MESENPPPPPSPPPPQPCSAKQSIHRLLPEEIIEEVLTRLPVKSLLRFRCVSKPWLSLIGCNRFVKTHLQNIAQNTSFSHHKLIFSDGGILKQYSLNSSTSNYVASTPNPTPTNHPCSIVVGCCNGLVCIAMEKGRNLVIWNPSTRISNVLPNHDQHVMRIDVGGFGWDETTGAYMVIVLLFLHSDADVEKLMKVYSSKTNAWKTLENPRALDEFVGGFQPGMFVSGKLHWFRFQGEIIAFDFMKSEEIETIKKPYKRSGELGEYLSAALGVLGGCFSVGCVYTNGIDVWVMKRYGVEESWMKVVTVSRLAYEACEHVLFAHPLCFGANGEILLYVGSLFAVYNPKGGVFLPLEGIKASQIAYLCIESLVSPDQQN